MTILLVAILSLQQTAAIDAKVIRAEVVSGPIAFSNPALNAKGMIEATAGHRLQIVEIALGAMPVDAEVGAFTLLAVSGRAWAPIGLGGGANSIFPLDRLPMGQEVGQILPNDAILAVTRHSLSRVTLEAGPRATIALLFEVPAGIVVASLRLPDGTIRKLKNEP